MTGSLNLLLTDIYPENCCPTPSYQFRTRKKPEWFNDQFVRKVIKEIDGADVLFEEALKDRYGHGISTEMISATSKYTILMYYFPEWTFITAAFGVNAWPLIKDILLGGKSLTMLVNSHVFADDVLDKGFPVYIDSKIITTDEELYDEILPYFDTISEKLRNYEYNCTVR